MEGIFERIEAVLSLLYENCKQKSNKLENECKHYTNMFKEWKSERMLEEASFAEGTEDVQLVAKQHSQLPFDESFSVITQEEFENIDNLLQRAKLVMQPVSAEFRKEISVSSSEIQKRSAVTSTMLQNPCSKIPIKIKLSKDQSLQRKTSSKQPTYLKNQIGNKLDVNNKCKSKVDACNKNILVTNKPSEKLHLGDNCNPGDSEYNQKKNVCPNHQELLNKLKCKVGTYRDLVVSFEHKHVKPSPSKANFYEEIGKIIESSKNSELQLCQKYIELSAIIENFSIEQVDKIQHSNTEMLKNKMAELEESFKLFVPDIPENLSDTFDFYKMMKDNNNALWYPVTHLQLPVIAQYSDQSDLMKYCEHLQNVQWMCFLLEFKNYLFKEFFPLFQALDPREEDFVYLFRGVYSLLCEDGLRLPILLENPD